MTERWKDLNDVREWGADSEEDKGWQNGGRGENWIERVREILGWKEEDMEEEVNEGALQAEKFGNISD